MDRNVVAGVLTLVGAAGLVASAFVFGGPAAGCLVLSGTLLVLGVLLGIAR